ncbi:hypothetical protein NLU13_0553 [Sarocladium strictum]|uniref:Uncharacterized protein n=1 Tax=Sarocladium strictum TaxID=5046 RepID=A0AA39LAW9_SARSR|nr:hypothetical protein NLU13_0553 [Sarocladium strictum]
MRLCVGDRCRTRRHQHSSGLQKPGCENKPWASTQRLALFISRRRSRHRYKTPLLHPPSPRVIVVPRVGAFSLLLQKGTCSLVYDLTGCWRTLTTSDLPIRREQ